MLVYKRILKLLRWKEFSKNGEKKNHLCIKNVFTWHMYWPRSSIRTFRMTSVHVLKSLWVTDKRSLFVMTCSWIAKIAFASAFIHATYTKPINKQTKMRYIIFRHYIVQKSAQQFGIFCENRQIAECFHSTKQSIGSTFSGMCLTWKWKRCNCTSTLSAADWIWNHNVL